MRFFELYAGGGYEIASSNDRDAAPLSFHFETRDLAEFERFTSGMYVELSLRPDRRGELAWCLDVPDRNVVPWSIPIQPEDLPKLGQRAGLMDGVPTVVYSGEGRAIDLTPFARHLQHDWSGRVGRALVDYSRGEPDKAQALLEEVVAEHRGAIPGAHHLLGRCRRAKGELREAIGCYHAAVRAASDRVSGRMIPYAAGPLSDMGVAYKKLGEVGRAVHCFLHSLWLRPNHPEALLSFFSMMPESEEYVLFAAARVMAIGGSEDLAAEFLANFARYHGADSDQLKAKAKRLARRVDLLRWPFGKPEFSRLDVFERGLQEGAADIAEHSAGELARTNAAVDVSAGRSWLKLK
jgi:tetratricopeptide (TPR) repeat protein